MDAQTKTLLQQGPCYRPHIWFDTQILSPDPILVGSDCWVGFPRVRKEIKAQARPFLAPATRPRLPPPPPPPGTPARRCRLPPPPGALLHRALPGSAAVKTNNCSWMQTPALFAYVIICTFQLVFLARTVFFFSQQISEQYFQP
jgi:hypothetical protein